MFKKAIGALTMLAGCLSAHAATQSFDFQYTSPDWRYEYHGQFSADDVNGDGNFSANELKSFKLNNFDWMGCVNYTCEVKDFSYQPGGKVELTATWSDNYSRSAYYHFPSVPNDWVYYESMHFCEGGGCYYFEYYDYPSENATFAITNTTPVPEPESWLMLGAGLAVVGAGRRRWAARRAMGPGLRGCCRTTLTGKVVPSLA